MMFLSELLPFHWQADTNPLNEHGIMMKGNISCSGDQWWLIFAVTAVVSTWSFHWSWHSTSTARLWTTSDQSQDTHLWDNRTVSECTGSNVAKYLHKRRGLMFQLWVCPPKSSCVLTKYAPKPLSFTTHLFLPCRICSADPKTEEAKCSYVRRK